MQTKDAKILVEVLQDLDIKNVFVSTMWDGLRCPEYVCASVNYEQLKALREHKILFIIHEWKRGKDEENPIGVYVTAGKSATSFPTRNKIIN